MDLKTAYATGDERDEVVRAEPSHPVFILAAPCSDASALATSLTASKDFWTSTESHLFYSFAGPDELGQSRIYSIFQNANADESFWLTRNQVVYPEFASFIGLGLDQMFLSRSGGKRWVEASAENTLIAPDLTYMFPNARFLNVLRDGRDVVALMLSHGMQPDTDEGFEAACEMWNVYVQRGLEFQEMFPGKTLEVRHEQLVHNSDTQAKWIMDFLEGPDAAAVAAHFATQADAFVERLWSDWSHARRERFVTLCGERMSEVGYAMDWY
jgi:hypothetical protein